MPANPAQPGSPARQPRRPFGAGVGYSRQDAKTAKKPKNPFSGQRALRAAVTQRVSWRPWRLGGYLSHFPKSTPLTTASPA